MRISRRQVREGQELPRFYLPVRRLDYSHCIECHFFLFAPFVLAYYIFLNVFHVIWMDLQEFNYLLTKWNKAKAPETNPSPTSPQGKEE